MNLPTRVRPERPAALGLAAAACALGLVLTSCGQSSGVSGATVAVVPGSGDRSASMAPAAGSTYALLQMSLCLSGLESCFGKVAYPGVVQEATARIRQIRPDAVTFNEACGNDVALIARRTGYHVRFSVVIYGGRPLPCVRPRGRGFFGDAVLTKAAIENSESQEFEAQTDIERRRWLCVITRGNIEVCTAHLSERTSGAAAANNAQCAELRGLLARRAVTRAVIFGGDLNRRSPCAPDGFWARTDISAEQNPGLQQVYGTGALRSPSASVVPAVHTDHDILLVRARLMR